MTSPANTTIKYGEKATLTWNATDDHPAGYAIYLDGVLQYNNTWLSGKPVYFSFSDLSEGTHNITIVFSDIYGLKTTYTSFIVVETLSPSTTIASTTEKPPSSSKEEKSYLPIIGLVMLPALGILKKRKIRWKTVP